WLLLAVGSAGAALGLASLFRWIPSRPASGTQLAAVETEAADAGEIDRPPSPPAPETVGLTLDSGDSAGAAAAVDPAPDDVVRRSSTALTVGWLSVGLSGFSDLIAIGTGGANRC